MLEYIVRPFQAPNSHGTIIIPSTPTESTETAVLTWGGEADLPETQYFTTGFEVKQGRQDFTENNRDAEKVRIYGEDPGDGPSYIDVERGGKLYFDTLTGRTVQSSSPGQSDYVAMKDLEDLEELSKKSANDPAKGKATIQLRNVPAGAPGIG